uniref:Uncharacterized protein n=1 Tax=Oryza nivara TaxID=4536 RepID=A0A0E0FGB5_ORYNI
MLVGISPQRPLELRFSLRRKVRFPMAGESVPARLLDGRFSDATRVGLRRLQVTPSQLQKLALLLFHEASALELLPVSPALKASSEASSLLDAAITAIVGTGRSPSKPHETLHNP